jgi:hypothetical protein
MDVLFGGLEDSIRKRGQKKKYCILFESNFFSFFLLGFGSHGSRSIKKPDFSSGWMILDTLTLLARKFVLKISEIYLEIKCVGPLALTHVDITESVVKQWRVANMDRQGLVT